MEGHNLWRVLAGGMTVARKQCSQVTKQQAKLLNTYGACGYLALTLDDL